MQTWKKVPKLSAYGSVCTSAEEAEGNGTRVEMYLCVYVRQRNRFTLCTGQFLNQPSPFKMRSTDTFYAYSRWFDMYTILQKRNLKFS
jgi:hypothetical protein